MPQRVHDDFGGIDEGPSEDDLDRFGDDETGFCPSCGAEMWDQADVCPKCLVPVDGMPLREPPISAWVRSRWMGAIAIVVLLAFFLAMVGRSLFS